MTTLMRYQPLVGQLDGLFNDLLRPALVWEGAQEPAPIRIDVSETAEEYKVRAEVPGVKKEEIAIDIEGNEVQISAEVKREAEARDGEKWLRTERFVGKAARRFALPQDIDETKAAAAYTNGVLELTLPKKSTVVGRRIAIQ
jgi:HSP20 family protein